MPFSLFPRTTKFYDLFARQNAQVNEAAGLLVEALGKPAELGRLCKQITALGEDGESLSREINRQLSLTFITPLDREDIHAINLTQRDVLSLIRQISIRMSFSDFVTFRPAAVQLIEYLQEILMQSGQMLAGLGKKRGLESHTPRLTELRRETYLLQELAIAETYEGVGQDPKSVLDVIKWTQIYDRIEQAVARAFDLVNVLEGVALKNG